MSGLLSPRPPAGALRQLIERDEPLLLPGCYDALGATLIERAGFDVVYMTGFGAAASLLGRPDIGLVSGTQMIDNARRITAAVSVPVVADADTGYGNPLNVIHTIREYEQAGIAGVHLEDQVTPKRCGHMENKEVIDLDDFTAKIRAAVDARLSADFILIARTDARAPLGLDEARRRAHAAVEAGADVLFIEALQTQDEIDAVAEEFADIPLVFNWVEGGKTPQLSYDELRELGFALVIMPITTLLAATAGMSAVLASVRQAGTPKEVGDELTVSMPSFSDFTELIGLPEVTELQRDYQ